MQTLSNGIYKFSVTIQSGSSIVGTKGAEIVEVVQKFRFHNASEKKIEGTRNLLFLILSLFITHYWSGKDKNEYSINNTR